MASRPQGAKECVQSLSSDSRSFHCSSTSIFKGAVQCKVPRDRMYSLISLVHKNDRLLGIKPEYRPPVEILFPDVARHSLHHQQELELL